MEPKIASLLAALFCLTSLAGCQSTDSQKDNYAGQKAYQRGDFTEAEKLYLVAVRTAEKFGEGDARLATSLSNLSAFYRAQGKYAEAEPLYNRYLAIREKTFGPDHP